MTPQPASTTARPGHPARTTAACPARGAARAIAAGLARGAVALPLVAMALVLTVTPLSRAAAQRAGGAGGAGERGEGGDGGAPIVVASKPFAESYLLAEMFAQLLEARGFTVDRRPGLGATEIAFQAVRTGAVDVYPEYTGTGLVAILGEEPDADPARVLARVRGEFARRWGAAWLAPLGFENTYAIAVRRETAERHGLRTLSDLARAGPDLTAGFSPDFIGRPDGLPGLREAYGLRFAATRSLLQSVKYEALAGGAVDVIDGYSTDGRIARYDLVVLEDDRAFFPAYQAAPLAGRRLAQARPAAVAALGELSGLLDEARMRRLNQRVEVAGEEVAVVAAAGLREVGLLGGRAATTAAGPGERTGAAAAAGAADGTGAGAAGEGGESGGAGVAVASDRDGLLAYLWGRRALILRLTLRHLLLVSVALLAAILVAVPLGLALERARVAAEGAIRSVGLLQTIPSIALLAFMIPLLGIGPVPAIVALFLYSLYPILRNTYSGVRDADPAAVDAARALGMTQPQVLRLVRLPLAAPIIMAGIRTAAVITVGTATLAAFIGAGGLGDPIVSGLALSDTRMILSGAIPAALLALLVDALLGLAEKAVSPRGVQL